MTLPAGQAAPAESDLQSRIAHAYYLYGRFCASHKVTCMLISLSTVVFLSSPLRWSLPSSSPLDVHYSTNVSATLRPPFPHWLRGPPRLFVQQLLVRAEVGPWNPRELSGADAVKGALSRAFKVVEALSDAGGASRLDASCVHVEADGASAALLPRRGCLLLSPALFWGNDMDRFFKESSVLERIYSEPCTASMCQRDLLLGMPERKTGVKPFYRTNRGRSIQFVVTAVLHSYDQGFWSSATNRLSRLEGFSRAEESDRGGHSTFIHIFYRAKKDLRSYVPLVFAYMVMIAYFHFNIAQIHMVKSKWGLALAEVFTIASSFTAAAGICVHFELVPTMWGAEIFPYLALAIGLENTLSLTQSVAQIDIKMDLRSRIAHGLAREGYVHTKNFLTEMVIIVIGFLTCIPDIQEFSTICLIGLVVDFYMQLMFYTPCLGFDLYRIDQDEDLRYDIARQLCTTAERGALPAYPASHCPVASLFPVFYGLSPGQQRRPQPPPRPRLSQSPSNPLVSALQDEDLRWDIARQLCTTAERGALPAYPASHCPVASLFPVFYGLSPGQQRRPQPPPRPRLSQSPSNPLVSALQDEDLRWDIARQLCTTAERGALPAYPASHCPVASLLPVFYGLSPGQQRRPQPPPRPRLSQSPSNPLVSALQDEDLRWDIARQLCTTAERRALPAYPASHCPVASLFPVFYGLSPGQQRRPQPPPRPRLSQSPSNPLVSALQDEDLRWDIARQLCTTAERGALPAYPASHCPVASLFPVFYGLSPGQQRRPQPPPRPRLSQSPSNPLVSALQDEDLRWDIARQLCTTAERGALPAYPASHCPVASLFPVFYGLSPGQQRRPQPPPRPRLSQSPSNPLVSALQDEDLRWDIARQLCTTAERGALPAYPASHCPVASLLPVFYGLSPGQQRRPQPPPRPRLSQSPSNPLVSALQDEDLRWDIARQLCTTAERGALPAYPASHCPVASLFPVFYGLSPESSDGHSPRPGPDSPSPPPTLWTRTSAGTSPGSCARRRSGGRCRRTRPAHCPVASLFPVFYGLSPGQQRRPQPPPRPRLSQSPSNPLVSALQDEDLRWDIARQLCTTAERGALPAYPASHCPVASLFPVFYGLSPGQQRRPQPPPRPRLSQSPSNPLVHSEEPRHVLRFQPDMLPRPLRALYYSLKGRAVQQLFMAATLLWIACLVAYATGQGWLRSGRGASEEEVSRPQWHHWQTRTYAWWPALMDNYNVSLHGQYLTLAPPIVFDAHVPTDDPAIRFQGGVPDDDSAPPSSLSGSEAGESTDTLLAKIYFLELRMTLVLYVSVAIFASVAAFLVWACTCGRGVRQSPETSTCHRCASPQQPSQPGPAQLLAFQPVDSDDVELLVPAPAGILVSVSLSGALRVWNARNGHCMRTIARSAQGSPTRAQTAPGTAQMRPEASPQELRQRRPPNGNGLQHPANGGLGLSSAPPTPQPPAIWALAVEQNLIVAGTSEGSLEFWDLNTAHSMGGLSAGSTEQSGVTHLLIRKIRVVLARASGAVEFFDLREAPGARQTPGGFRLEAHLVVRHQAHPGRLCLFRESDTAVATSGEDGRISFYRIAAGTLAKSVDRADLPAKIVDVKLDEANRTLYAASAEGSVWCMVCGGDDQWHLVETGCGGGVAWGLASNALLCYSAGRLRFYNRLTKELLHDLCYQASESSEEEGGGEERCCWSSEDPQLLVLSDSSVFTASRGHLELWDAREATLLRRQRLEQSGSEVRSPVLLPPLPQATDQPTAAFTQGRLVYRLR